VLKIAKYVEALKIGYTYLEDSFLKQTASFLQMIKEIRKDKQLFRE
jgi:hypothetical protein